MDRIPSQSKVAFIYSNLSHEGSQLSEPWQIYLRIVSDLEITILGQTVYSERLFPVVEFAIQSQIWSASESETGRDFVFTSMESEEEGIVWIRRRDGGWQVGSLLKEREASQLVAPDEMLAALDALYFQLRSEVKTLFHVDIETLFAWKRAAPPTKRHPL